MRRRKRTKKISKSTFVKILASAVVIISIAALIVSSVVTNCVNKNLKTKYDNTKLNIRNGYKLMLHMDRVNNVALLPIMWCGRDYYCYESQLAGIFPHMTPMKANDMPKSYYISANTSDSPFSWHNVPYIFMTDDGVVMGVEINTKTQAISVFVDLNGVSGPNMMTVDMFKFKLTEDAKVFDATSDINYPLYNSARKK